MINISKMMEVARDSIETVFKKQFGAALSFEQERQMASQERWCSDERGHIASTAEIFCDQNRYCLIFCFTESSFLQHISAMFGREFTEISSDLHDLISEWLNMTLAKMKIYLNDEMEQSYQSSIPMTILGQKLCVPNSTDLGMMNVVISSGLGEFDFFIARSEKAIIPWDQF